MLIRPNRSVLEGKVGRIEPTSDGWGSTVVLTAEACQPARGYPDFVRAKRGGVFNLFATDASTLATGKTYRMHVSLVGGPGGQRIVIESAKQIAERRTLPVLRPVLF